MTTQKSIWFQVLKLQSSQSCWARRSRIPTGWCTTPWRASPWRMTASCGLRIRLISASVWVVMLGLIMNEYRNIYKDASTHEHPCRCYPKCPRVPGMPWRNESTHRELDNFVNYLRCRACNRFSASQEPKHRLAAFCDFDMKLCDFHLLFSDFFCKDLWKVLKFDPQFQRERKTIRQSWSICLQGTIRWQQRWP